MGGIEASLRRVVHYDYWSNSLRKSILFDAKADVLLYGMGEKTIIEIAEKIKNKEDLSLQRGICYISKEKMEDYLELPSYEETVNDKYKFIEMFNKFYENNDCLNAVGLQQKQDTRYLIQNPPNFDLKMEELDKIYEMDYEMDAHPYYKKDGEIRALDTIRNSITTHRGCYGECNFCAIAVHQGRRILMRSEESILREAEKITNSKYFKGYINDVGGPTANMYGIECEKKIESGACKNKRCIYPSKCGKLDINHGKQIRLLNKISRLKNVKKVFVASGIRYDMIMADNTCGEKYLENIVENHVSGQMKIAPEHTEDKVLKLMGKPDKSILKKFKEDFDRINKEKGKKQFLTYYFIAAHPGCKEEDMIKLKRFAENELKVNPEQIQIFTPTPSTYSTLMYYTGINPFNGEEIYVAREQKDKEKQKNIVIEKLRRY